MKMYGLVKKGTKDLLRIEAHNGPEEGEITHGPWYTLSDEAYLPIWLVGNYDVALKMTKPPGNPNKSFMYDSYETPGWQYGWEPSGRRKAIELEVVEVTLMVR